MHFKYKEGMTYGNFTVIERLDKRRNGKLLMVCRCVCGEIVEFNAEQIKDRKSCGCTKRSPSVKPSVYVGEIYESNNYGTFEVVEYKGATDVTIRFVDTGTLLNTCADSVRRGLVSDPIYPRIHKVGYIGIGPHKVANPDRSLTTAYYKWVNMLSRCYNKSNKGYGAYGKRGVVVVDEWHCYQNFAEWFYENYRDGYVLDKDILKQGNKVYGPETCCFIPMEINQMFIRRRKSKDLLPRGVYANKNRFIARAPDSIDGGGRGHLGSFSKAHDAFLAYKSARESIIKRRAEAAYHSGKIDQRVYESMMRYEVYPYT